MLRIKAWAERRRMLHDRSTVTLARDRALGWERDPIIAKRYDMKGARP